MGLNAAGLVVPAGRISCEQLLEVARLADAYGDGQVRLTPGQNLIIPNVPDARLEDLKAEPLLSELRHDAPEIMKGLVSCTGIDYCHFALIETKELAVGTAAKLHDTLGDTGPLTMHWSGCPNACGNHTVADIGLQGKRARVDGEVIDAVDVSLGEKFAGMADGESLNNVPCDELPEVLTRILSRTPATGRLAPKSQFRARKHRSQDILEESWKPRPDPLGSSKATRINLFSLRKPHMRTFHMTWFAFFLAFFGWFGIAPMMALVRDDLGLTKTQIGNTIIASVAITILARLAIGWLCDRIGPRLAYSGLLVLGSIPVMCIGLANSYESFLLFRLAIGIIGASFVITQYHTSMMFAPNVVGTANATTAGWGNMGGGVTQMVMPLVLAAVLMFGVGETLGWRVAMVVPGMSPCS